MSQFPEEQLNKSGEGFGHFPAYPGQRLNDGRYEIIRKLGYGPRSSAWLVIDSHDDEYFAIKILTVHETLQKPSYELDALVFAEKRGYLSLYGTFTVTSHHGAHLCLVLDVVGTSYEDLRLSSPMKSLRRHIVQRAIACVLEELLELHRYGHIHGAVTASNIVFDVGISQNFDYGLSKSPPCTIEQKITTDGVEYPIVRSQPISTGVKWDHSWDVINRVFINLTNFGHAQVFNDRPTWEKSRMDKSLRPPEVILGLPYSKKVDIWMLGCSTYHMLTGKPLVYPELTASDGAMLAWLIAMSGGSIPPEMALKSSQKTKYFDKNGTFKLDLPTRTLERQVLSGGVVPEEDIPGIVKFIQKCLTLDPENRPGAKDLVTDEWVMPGFEG